MTEAIYPHIHRVDKMLREISRSTFVLRDEVERGYNSIENIDGEIIGNIKAEMAKIRNSVQDTITYFAENQTNQKLENSEN